jgi:hypothetical protein
MGQRELRLGEDQEIAAILTILLSLVPSDSCNR